MSSQKQASPQFLVKVDPAVALAVRKASAPRPKFWLPLLRLVLFQLWFLPTSGLMIPLIALRNLLPFMRPCNKWSLQYAVGILTTRWTMYNLIFFRLQPLAPREGGWRERPGLVGAALSLLNVSGPGGRVILHPKKSAKQVARAVDKMTHRTDRVWFSAPPLEYFRGVLTIKTGRPGKADLVKGSSSYNGMALLDPSWAKQRTRAFWFMHRDGMEPPALNTGKRDRPVWLYFHGGAGVTFGAGDIFMGQTLARNLAHTTGIDVFSVDYNLAPHAPFPATVTQALGAWIYLQELGYSPNQILVGGDSYGAFLTMAFERYLRTEMPVIFGEDHKQKPLGLLLLSPYVSAHNDGFPSREAHLKYDIILEAYGKWGSIASKVSHPGDIISSPTDPWISAVDRSLDEFADLPACFVANGELECLVDEGKELVAKMRKAGVPVEHDIAPYEVHDYFTMAQSLPAAIRCYRKVDKWAKALLANQPYELA